MNQHPIKTCIRICAAIGISCGLTVGCSQSVPENTSEQAKETPASPENSITAYARSILDIEPVRKQAYNKIAELVAADPDAPQPPAVRCNDRNTLSPLRGEVKKTAIDYCNQAQEIAKKNGLTAKQFNEITQQLESDPQLKEGVKNELIKLQQPTQPSS